MVPRNYRVCLKGCLCFMTMGLTMLPLTSVEWPPVTSVEVRCGTKWIGKSYHWQVWLTAEDALNEFILCNSPFRWTPSHIWTSACMTLVPANPSGTVLASAMLSQPMPISVHKKVQLFTGDHQLCAVSTRQLRKTPGNGFAGVTAARRTKDMLVFNQLNTFSLNPALLPLVSVGVMLFILMGTGLGKSPHLVMQGEVSWS